MTHVALSVLFGALIGLSLGLVGGGGSILTVPILVYAIGQPVQAATTTSLAIVGLNALVGMAGHARERRVDFRTGLDFGGVGIGGALIGSWLNTFVPASVLLVLFALIMLVAAAAMLRRRSELSGTGQMHDGARGAREWATIAASGTVVGLMTGFFGVGGFVIVPALVLGLGLSMRLAVGTSLLIIAYAAGDPGGMIRTDPPGRGTVRGASRSLYETELPPRRRGGNRARGGCRTGSRPTTPATLPAYRSPGAPAYRGCRQPCA